MIPWLSERIALDGLRVADLGCHHSGILDALREDDRVREGVGFELSEELVRSSPFVADDRFRLRQGDALALGETGEPFDLVLLCEVLEHIPRFGDVLTLGSAAARSRRLRLRLVPTVPLALRGAPQLASNVLRFLPYVHYLPERAVLPLMHVEDNAYMSRAQALEDLTSVRRTRLTIGRFEQVISRTALRRVARSFYLLRPEYRVRYGTPVIELRGLGRVPGVRELLVMGAYYLLQAGE